MTKLKPIMRYAFALYCACCAESVVAQLPPDKPSTHSRIIRRFDFDERKLGNFESLPMNWLRIDARGYPSFLEPAFDLDHGHTTAPSFFMSIRTGNVGAYYRAKDIVADANSEYRISAWVHTEELQHAGAIITAFYYDHTLTKIEASEQRSRAVRSENGWTQVHVDLPGGNARARWIGLSCRIEQPSIADDTTSAVVPIHYTDVTGSAWFDDIVIMRRPRVSLTLDRVDHFYRSDETITCDAELFDLDGLDLDIELKIQDAEARTVFEQRLGGQSLIGMPRRVEIGQLPAGLYQARLTMSLDGRTIADHPRTFAVLAHDANATPDNGGVYGLVLTPDDLDHSELPNLIRRLAPALIKIPVWRHETNDQSVIYGDEAARNLVQTAVNDGIAPIAVLAETPTSLLPDNHRPPRPDALLSGGEDWMRRWEPYLNIVTSRYGGYIDHWQLGTDASAPQLQDKTLAKALTILRRYLAPLIGQPRIIVPQDALTTSASAARTADLQTVYFPAHVQPATPTSIAENAPTQKRWATLALPDASGYQRETRLARFAKQLLLARAAGYERVFIERPWNYRDIEGLTVIEPREEAVIFHALAQATRGQNQIERLSLHPQIDTWLFTSPTNERGTLVLCSLDESQQLVELDLPDETRLLDAWGREHSIERTNGLARITVGPMPMVLSGVQPAALRFQDSFELDDAVLTVAIEEHQRTLRLRNTFADDIEGELVLAAPRGWRLTPRRIALRLQPGELSETRLFIKPPTNETIGTQRLFGQIRLGERGPSRVWTPLSVATPGLDVSVFGYIEGDGVRFFQRVTNRSDKAIDLRSYMIAPEMPRVSRSIRSLGAGETAVREYVYPSAAQLDGRPVRLSLEEIDGGLRHNEVLRVPYRQDETRRDLTGGNANLLDSSAAARALSRTNGG